MQSKKLLWSFCKIGRWILQEAWCLLEPIASSPINIPAHLQPMPLPALPVKRQKKPSAKLHPALSQTSSIPLPDPANQASQMALTGSDKHSLTPLSPVQEAAQQAQGVPEPPAKPRKQARKSTTPPEQQREATGACNGSLQPIMRGDRAGIGIQDIVWAQLHGAHWPATVLYIDTSQVNPFSLCKAYDRHTGYPSSSFTHHAGLACTAMTCHVLQEPCSS